MKHDDFVEDANLDPLIRRLVETRKAWQLSATEIADRISSDYNTFRRYETGERFPSGKKLVQWADVLGFELSLWPKRGD